MKIKITSENAEQRLDTYLTSVLDTTRSNINKHIKTNSVK